MTVTAQPINKRPYIIMYYDCFESEIFDNQSQRTVYMTLKKFADANNQCFPALKKIASVALLSKRAVQKALKELQNKLLVTIENRFRKDGSQTSNLYTIHDVTELQITGNAKNAKDVENAENVTDIENTGNTNNETEAAKIIEQCEDDTLISMMEARGYIVFKNDDIPTGLQNTSALNSASETVSDNNIMAQNESTEENKITEIEKKAEDVVVQENESVLNNTMPEKENSTIGNKIMSKLKNIAKKEKEPTSTPLQAKNVSTKKNQSSSNDDTTKVTESQPLERYTMEEIRKRYDYYIYMLYNPTKRTDIDIVFDILYDALNTTKETLRVNSEDKPAMVVISKLLKLDMEDILYVIEKYREQTGRIKNVKSYLLSMLYNAKEQYHLDIQNQVSHDMDQWHEQKAQERMNKLE